MSVLEDEVIVIEHPPEEVVKTSPLVVIAGFAVGGGQGGVPWGVARG